MQNLDLECASLDCIKIRGKTESLMHLMAYKARSDVYAIAHTHSKFATSFSMANCQVKCNFFL
ncbi:class II aldolase/adducin family protein [uncultured Mitsuokella sp.]|uniref:class II aldolase/adducin family protein n=1 Tax=uncultured Mitsuokella sp. TaxID=453120 RepID=UPI0034500A32